MTNWAQAVQTRVASANRAFPKHLSVQCQAGPHAISTAVLAPPTNVRKFPLEELNVFIPAATLAVVTWTAIAQTLLPTLVISTIAISRLERAVSYKIQILV